MHDSCTCIALTVYAIRSIELHNDTYPAPEHGYNGRMVLFYSESVHDLWLAVGGKGTLPVYSGTALTTDQQNIEWQSVM